MHIPIPMKYLLKLFYYSSCKHEKNMRNSKLVFVNCDIVEFSLNFITNSIFVRIPKQGTLREHVHSFLHLPEA